MSINIDKLQENLLNFSNLLVEAEKLVNQNIDSLPADKKTKAKTYFEDIKKRSQSPNFDIKKEQEDIPTHCE